jgi:hypothetical protein
MTTIETQIVIDAPPLKVWGILTDFPAMPTWNPFIRTISGTPAPGDSLVVQIAPPGQSAMTFKPTVLIATPERELRWLGTFMGRWIFAGEHYFVLDQVSPGTTHLTHGERFSGLLRPLIMRRQMLAATKQGFVAMNEALKRRSE